MTEDVVKDWRGLLDDAHRALRDTVAGVPRDGWDRPTPCTEWNVTQVFQHATGDQLGYSAILTGGPRPAEDPFSPSGRLGGDPVTLGDAVIEVSAEAWAGVDDEDEAVPVPLPQGPMPAWLAGGACALDAAVHSWDMAVATGQPSPLTPAMAEPLMTVARAIVEPLRAYGVYGPAIPPEPGADASAELLCFLGRRPDWAS